MSELKNRNAYWAVWKSTIERSFDVNRKRMIGYIHILVEEFNRVTPDTISIKGKYVYIDNNNIVHPLTGGGINVSRTFDEISLLENGQPEILDNEGNVIQEAIAPVLPPISSYNTTREFLESRARAYGEIIIQQENALDGDANWGLSLNNIIYVEKDE